MRESRLGRATTIALVMVPVFISLGLVLGGLNSILRERPSLLRFGITVLALVALARIYQQLATRWPALFSDQISARGPRLTPRRGGVLVTALLVWGLVLIFGMSSGPLDVFSAPLWRGLLIGGAWYAVLVGAIHALERSWLKEDTRS